MDDLKTLAIVLPGTINTAIKHGVDIQAILHKYGVSVDLQNITESTIDLQVLHAIVKEVERVAKTPAIGLQTGKDFDFDFLPHLKTYLMSAPTLREVFKSFTLFGKLISPILNLIIEESELGTMLILRPDADLSFEDERHYSEMVFSTLHSLVKKLLKEDVSLISVSFRHNQSHLLSVYENFFNSSIYLNKAENFIIFDKDIVDKPLPGSFPEIHLQSRKILEQQIADSPLQKGLVKRITRVITRQKGLLNQPVETVAHSLHMSARTLQRRLTEEGTSFVELKDKIKFKLAAAALKSSNQTIEEISEELGFSDRRSFSRAFNRWSGMTPTFYRKQKSK